MSATETCTCCCEQADAVHEETGLCPKCTRKARSRRPARRHTVAELSGQIDIFEVLAETDEVTAS